MSAPFSILSFAILLPVFVIVASSPVLSAVVAWVALWVG